MIIIMHILFKNVMVSTVVILLLADYDEIGNRNYDKRSIKEHLY